jgi:hypothetical protein
VGDDGGGEKLMLVLENRLSACAGRMDEYKTGSHGFWVKYWPAHRMRELEAVGRAGGYFREWKW